MVFLNTVLLDPIEQLHFHFFVLNLPPSAFLSLNSFLNPSLNILFRDLEGLSSCPDAFLVSHFDRPHFLKARKDVVLASFGVPRGFRDLLPNRQIVVQRVDRRGEEVDHVASVVVAFIIRLIGSVDEDLLQSLEMVLGVLLELRGVQEKVLDLTE
jgi:hypothetical protein